MKQKIGFHLVISIILLLFAISLSGLCYLGLVFALKEINAAMHSIKIHDNHQFAYESYFNKFRSIKLQTGEMGREIYKTRKTLSYKAENGKENYALEPARENNSLAKSGQNHEKTSADLDNDSLPENYVLDKGQLTVYENKKLIWRTPENWWVDDYILADANNDGISDLNLSVWKEGNYGSSKPFWVENNDLSIKNHFFIFDFKDKNKFTPLWQSSNLARPNCGFVFFDVNNDKKQELIVLEGEYNKDFICAASYAAVWAWDGWGFSNEWRSDGGKFGNLSLEKMNGKNAIFIAAQ